LAYLQLRATAPESEALVHLKSRSMMRGVSMALWAVLAFTGVTAHGAATIASANAALQAGKADEASAVLNEILAGDANNAEANNLLCRVQFSLQRFDQAAGYCEKAIRVVPQNARYHLWLGRVVGERASRASWTSAFSLAKKTRDEFETAAKLAPKDGEILSDLGEFYTDAPGVVGGGTDKAEGIAQRLDAIDASRGHHLHGLIAEKKKDLGGAETEFKAATAGGHAGVPWTNLASFYRRHERWQEMESAVTSGAAAAKGDKSAATALYNGASILARANRQPEQAMKLFEAYLASPYKTEEGPAFEALVRLSKLRKQAGDAAGAERDKAAALALAHEYKPALELK